VEIKAADHDFSGKNALTVTPVGIFLPNSDARFLDGITSKVTSDCLGDRLVHWGETVKDRFSHRKMLVIHLDNGPENKSRRTQCMKRMGDFAQEYHLHLRFAYDPPSHSN
jgi:hypothetical protein